MAKKRKLRDVKNLITKFLLQYHTHAFRFQLILTIVSLEELISIIDWKELLWIIFNNETRLTNEMVLLALRSGYGYALNDCKILMEEDWSLVYDLLKKNRSAVKMARLLHRVKPFFFFFKKKDYKFRME